MPGIRSSVQQICAKAIQIERRLHAFLTIILLFCPSIAPSFEWETEFLCQATTDAPLLFAMSVTDSDLEMECNLLLCVSDSRRSLEILSAISLLLPPVLHQFSP